MRLLLLLLVCGVVVAETPEGDWAQLKRYRQANADLKKPPQVVFYGDSITDGWDLARYFPGENYANRGISGQTTPQMLVRFQQDVVHLKPQLVVILAGTNDIAGNTGPATPEMIEDNFRSMLAVARANGIRVAIASVLPADHYSWRPGVQPAEAIRTLNGRLKALCEREKLVYLDYYGALANARGGLDPKLAADGVHPTPEGYAVMAPLAKAAVARALP